ncbi:uncharacterized protein B0P05DRAFT_565975 [Gilbertella persicaria]|uniref:uncharacterized protein n=1 Tax=Gilbertella persicaria TaxID=101096 RepID=UPI0022200B9E|nr:uncharacterized protein B0P05DRAFT_565975 [Gilbertella persicaria]KAI8047431.1 hypothetical protein B0P05DRAFT_565975 [Gilbertella persicaria]
MINQPLFDYEPVVVVHVAPSIFPVYMTTVRIYQYESLMLLKQSVNMALCLVMLIMWLIFADKIRKIVIRIPSLN